MALALVGASAEQRRLRDLIAQWNENRLDLFALSEPNQALEFHGVMRFYFQEPGEKVATKCVRVSSHATTLSVLEALIEKFHPDMKMLANSSYSIWEVHENRQERRLGLEEHPLVVQLGWHKDDREGRFVLRRDEPARLSTPFAIVDEVGAGIERAQHKRFSKREQKKHKDQARRDVGDEDTRSIYAEVPETTFTRTISNPEAVMKRRREKKLENKIREIGHGGSLKIYGVELFPNRPYVTLLVRASDTAWEIVGAALDKYNVERANPSDFVLVELALSVAESNLSQSFSDLRAATNASRERYLADDELPLLKLSHCPNNNLVYLLRRRPNNFPPQRSSSGHSITHRAPSDFVDDDIIYQRLQHSSTADDIRHSRPYPSTASLPIHAPSNIPGPTPSQSYPMGFDRESANQPTHFGVEEENPLPNSRMPVSNPAQSVPCLVDLYPEREEEFIRSELFGQQAGAERFGFRLTPAFTLYMVCRHRLTLPSTLSQQYLNTLLRRLTHTLYDHIHVNASNSAELVFWLGNASEFLHMLKQVPQLQAITAGAQDELEQNIEKSFEFFVESRRLAIHQTFPMFLSMREKGESAVAPLIAELEATVQIIRRSSMLNPAFTIQIFAHLFHFINMYSFNWLVTTEDGKFHLTHSFGQLLRERLHMINSWAERQGLEQACECHMDRLVQAVNLLVTPKTIDQIASLGATCYKLNSVQIRYLLENFQPLHHMPAESAPNRELIEHVCYLARQQADLLAEQDDQPIQLEEFQSLQLPFLSPRDGYVVESLQGIPADTMNYLISLQSRGLIAILLQNHTNGRWAQTPSIAPMNGQPVVAPPLSSLPPVPTHHAQNYAAMQKKDERPTAKLTLQLLRVTLRRGVSEGIGLSIVAAQGIGDKTVGIYVKKVVPGSAAHRDGRLAVGDKLLSVNGQSLLGISQEEAAQRMVSAGQEVHFEVAKNAAATNGLDAWLKADAPGNQKKEAGSVYAPVPNGNSQLLRHNRSISASELYSQADTISLTSLNSQQLPSQLPMQHQPFSTSAARLPPHYRPSSRQPTLVSQPLRPTSTTPVSHGGRQSIPNGHVGYPSGLNGHPGRQGYRSASTAPSSAVMDYSNLPLIGGGQHNPGAMNGNPRVSQPYRDGEENASLNSSTNSSGGNEVGATTTTTVKIYPAPQSKATTHLRVNSTNPTSISSSSTSPLPPPPAHSQFTRRQQNGGLHARADGDWPQRQAVPSTQQRQASGRSSAPLFGAEIPATSYSLIPIDRMSAKELNAELDRLDSKETMTEADRNRYRQAITALDGMKGRAPLATSHSASAFAHRRMYSDDRGSNSLSAMGLDPPNRPKGNFVLPYMNEMESKLQEAKKKRAAKGSDFSEKMNFQTSRSHIETAIDDFSYTASKLANTSLDSPGKEETDGRNGHAMNGLHGLEKRPV